MNLPSNDNVLEPKKDTAKKPHDKWRARIKTLIEIVTPERTYKANEIVLSKSIYTTYDIAETRAQIWVEECNAEVLERYNILQAAEALTPVKEE